MTFKIKIMDNNNDIIFEGTKDFRWDEDVVEFIVDELAGGNTVIFISEE